MIRPEPGGALVDPLGPPVASSLLTAAWREKEVEGLGFLADELLNGARDLFLAVGAPAGGLMVNDLLRS